MKPDMILQVLSNAELLFTNKTLVGSLTIVNVHVICKLVLGEELHGTNFAVKKHDGTALFLCVLLKVNLKTFSLRESLETEVASVKCSVCFHRLHIMHGSVLSQCTDVQEILATVSTGHVTCSVSQFVFAECISSTEFHIALLTLKLVSTSVKVDVFFKIT